MVSTLVFGSWPSCDKWRMGGLQIESAKEKGQPLKISKALYDKPNRTRVHLIFHSWFSSKLQQFSVLVFKVVVGILSFGAFKLTKYQPLFSIFNKAKVCFKKILKKNNQWRLLLLWVHQLCYNPKLVDLAGVKRFLSPTPIHSLSPGFF